MSKTPAGSGPFNPGPGRRSRYDSPMARTAFTAHVSEIVFFRVYSGKDDTISRGVQVAVERLTQLDAEAQQAYEVAAWVCERAERQLENLAQPSDQEHVLRYVAANYSELMAQYRAETN